MHFSAIPGTPPEIILNQTEDPSGDCVLYLSWSSLQSDNVSHYMVHINGDQPVNKTHTNSTWQLFAYPVCDCEPHTVRVRAVNIGDCAGISTASETVVPRQLPNVTCLTEPPPFTSTTITTTTAANAFTTSADSQCPVPQNSSESSLHYTCIIDHVENVIMPQIPQS